MIIWTSILTSVIGFGIRISSSLVSNFAGTTGKLRMWSLNSLLRPALLDSAWCRANASSVDAHPNIVMSKTLFLVSHSLSQKSMFCRIRARSSYYIVTISDLIISEFFSNFPIILSDIVRISFFHLELKFMTEWLRLMAENNLIYCITKEFTSFYNFS